jgi:hypothetical protein
MHEPFSLGLQGTGSDPITIVVHIIKKKKYTEKILAPS